MVAAWLAEFGGRPLAEPPRIQWQAPSSFSPASAVDAAEEPEEEPASVIEAADEIPESEAAQDVSDPSAGPSADDPAPEGGPEASEEQEETEGAATAGEAEGDELRAARTQEG